MTVLVKPSLLSKRFTVFLAENLYWGPILLGLMPILLVLLQIIRWGIDIPVWDAWWSAFLYLQAEYIPAGERLAMMWRLTNEHRTFLPQLLTDFIYYLTNMNTLVLIYINFFLLVITTFFLVHIYWRTNQSKARLVFVIPATYLIFTQVMGDRWINPNAMVISMAVFFSIGSLWVLTTQRTGWRTFLFAAIFAYCGSLSFSTGNMTWIVGLFVLWGRGYRKWLFYLIWLALAASVFFPYIFDLMAVRSSSVSNIGSALGELPRYLLVFLGTPLASTFFSGIEGEAVRLGALGLVIFLVAIVFIWIENRKKIEALLPWITIVIWVMLNGVQAGVSRIAMLTSIEIPSRYIIYGSIFWVCVMALTLRIITEYIPVKKKLSAFAMLFSLGIGINYILANYNMISMNILRDFSYAMQTNQTCLQQFAFDSNCGNIYSSSRLQMLYPHLAALRPSFMLAENETELALLGNLRTQAQINDAGNQAQIDFLQSANGKPYIFAHSNSTITWELTLPLEEYLGFRSQLWVQANETVAGSDGVLYQLIVTEDQTSTILLNELVLPNADRSSALPVFVNLSDYSGKTIQLSLQTSAGLDDTYNANYDWSFWLNPEIVVPTIVTITPAIDETSSVDMLSWQVDLREPATSADFSLTINIEDSLEADSFIVEAYDGEETQRIYETEFVSGLLPDELTIFLDLSQFLGKTIEISGHVVNLEDESVSLPVLWVTSQLYLSQTAIIKFDNSYDDQNTVIYLPERIHWFDGNFTPNAYSTIQVDDTSYQMIETVNSTIVWPIFIPLGINADFSTTVSLAETSVLTDDEEIIVEIWATYMHEEFVLARHVFTNIDQSPHEFNLNLNEFTGLTLNGLNSVQLLLNSSMDESLSNHTSVYWWEPHLTLTRILPSP